MDREQLCKLVLSALDSLSADVQFFFESEDVIRAEVVSDLFVGMKLSKRLELINEKTLDLVMSDEFKDHHLVCNPLTKNEKFNGLSETTFNKNQEETNLKSASAIL
jgi:stress-induced morphogen